MQCLQNAEDAVERPSLITVNLRVYMYREMWFGCEQGELASFIEPILLVSLTYLKQLSYVDILHFFVGQKQSSAQQHPPASFQMSIRAELLVEVEDGIFELGVAVSSISRIPHPLRPRSKSL